MDWYPDEDVNEQLLGDLDISGKEITDDEMENIRYQISGDFTSTAVQVFESLLKFSDKNKALSVMIEALSETLGNFVALVSDTEQEDVILSAMQVVEQSTVLQQEHVARMIYGQVGHS